MVSKRVSIIFSSPCPLIDHLPQEIAACLCQKKNKKKQNTLPNIKLPCQYNFKEQCPSLMETTGFSYEVKNCIGSRVYLFQGARCNHVTCHHVTAGQPHLLCRYIWISSIFFIMSAHTVFVRAGGWGGVYTRCIVEKGRDTEDLDQYRRSSVVCSINKINI